MQMADAGRGQHGRDGRGNCTVPADDRHRVTSGLHDPSCPGLPVPVAQRGRLIDEMGRRQSRRANPIDGLTHYQQLGGGQLGQQPAPQLWIRVVRRDHLGRGANPVQLGQQLDRLGRRIRDDNSPRRFGTNLHTVG